MILSKQEVFDADPKIIQKVSFIWTPYNDTGFTVLFVFEKSKENLPKF